ncbi:MAG: hypothetical protein ABR594_16635 [Pyrinomonadaceae bacterium]
MLSTFLSQLQSYFSKYFVIGTFFPVLCFAFFNGLTGYLIWPQFRAWVDTNAVKGGISQGAFLFTSITIGVLLFAYVWSSLSTFLRQVLEGDWGEFLSNLFVPPQKRRREALIKALKQALVELTDFREEPEWRKSMVAARNAGIDKNPNKQTRKPANDPFEKKLDKFEEEESKNNVISAEDLRQAVVELSELLKKQNVDEDLYLDKYQRRLLAVIEYAGDRVQARYVQGLNELHTSFGSNEIEPTKMGNIARTIQSYALRRYQCNLEAIWSNLQRVVQKDEKAHAALMEAKTQLDFLVSCCWLTLLWSIIWAVVFVRPVPSRYGFLGAAVGGPLLAYMWYRIAAEQYRSFADVAMTTLDVFRFALLEQMRLGTPYDVEDERFIWRSLDQLTTFEEPKNFRYIKSASSANE